MWGLVFLQLRLPSPWAFLSVLSGIGVMTSQSYLPHFKSADGSYHLTGEHIVSKF